MVTFWPSTKPASLRPSRKATTDTLSLANLLLRNPIIGIAGCCARAASGHAAAAPPSAASNSRRPMVTVIRPSRARRVEGRIARLQCAVFTFKEGRMLVASTSVVSFGFRSGKLERVNVFRFAPESGPQRLITACRMSAITGCEQSQQSSPLFDHLVGAGEQAIRHREAKGLRGFEVDHKLVFGRRLHWKV